MLSNLADLKNSDPETESQFQNKNFSTDKNSALRLTVGF